ncbi:hypothetical protein [Actinoplanes solisilvae]|uniref:hypothetical protein n=1 Tax=Actinoplanes solisilvae TaxID=2486853 RepID=UPI000FD8E4FE|nr:hypothetical protein [Actinoplanes solisilvae]
MIRRSGVATLGIALAVSVTACASDDSGELDFGGDPVTQCVRIAEDSSMVVGAVVRAPAGADLVIKNLSLEEPQGVQATEAFVVLLNGRAPILNANYPPSTNQTWESRIPAAKATVRAGEEANLLVVVKRGALDGSAAGMRLDYDGGSQTNSTTYQFRANCGAA